MSRRCSAPQDSLELLLDTICNTFGGVLFIAILVVMLLRQTSAMTDGQAKSRAPASPVEIQSLSIELDAATAELARLSENRNSQEVVAAQFAPTEVRKMLEERREIVARQNELQAEVDQLRLKNAKTAAQIETLRQDNDQVRINLRDAVERNQKATELLETGRQSRVQEVRLPTVRSAFAKSEIGLILRYGRLYVWHHYGPGNERLGLNTDEFVVVSDDGSSLVTRPIPTKGVPLDGSEESKQEIRRRLSQFDPKSCYLVVIVRPDSFDVFKHLRDEAVALKFDYRLMPMQSDSGVVDRGGRGGQVQ